MVDPPWNFFEADPEYWCILLEGVDPVPDRYDGKPKQAGPEESPRVIVFEPGPVDDMFVSEYGSSLGYIQQYWFSTREEAAEHAKQDYGARILEWNPIPPDEEDPEVFALELAAARFGRSG